MLRSAIFRSSARSASHRQQSTLVTVHGAGGGAWEFDLWREPCLRAGWHTVAYDLEPCPTGIANTTLNDYVEQVVRWPRCSGEKLALVGASMGGAVALQAAAVMSPSALVLVNSVVPKPWVRPTVRTSRPLPDVLEWSGSSLESTARALYDSSPAVQRWACQRWRDESGSVMRGLYGGYDAPRPDCPILFVISLDDRDVPSDQQRAWAAAWGADTLTYPEMSHCGPLLGMRAPEVAKEIVAWLASNTT